ncbi:MAG: hypothetical protein JO372_10405 [Solirubrobacterales bacterium]|nr:hypothetical protein [Solirubrobacterales bacterium]
MPVQQANRRRARRVASFLPLTVAICSGPAVAHAPRSPQAEIQAAMRAGPKAELALVAGSRGDVPLERALLTHAITTTTSVPIASAGYLKPGCKGALSSEHTITVFGIHIATQQVILDGFCWRDNRITSWGSTQAKRWSSFAYCWKDTSEGSYWVSRPKWRESYATGTLGGNAVVGCVSLQHDTPNIVYANGGGVWKH